MLNHFDGMEGFDKTVFKETAEWLLKQGYAFDLVSDKQITDQLKPNGTLLQSVKHNYKTILLSDVKIIPLTTLKKLKLHCNHENYCYNWQIDDTNKPTVF